MKIAVDARFLDRDRRGMGRYVSAMLAALAATGRCEMVLMTERGAAEARGVDVCWCPWSRVDLVAPNAAVVVTIHDLAPVVTPRKGLLRVLDRRHDRRRLEACVTRADGVVTVSDFVGDELVRHLGVDRRRLTTIHEGVSRRFFAASGERDADLLLWVGADEERKNLARLLQAAVAVRRSGRQLRLVLCGDNPGLLERHRRDISALGPGGVTITGYVPDEELVERYRTAGVYVCPSVYEGFGLPVLEAMAAGTPVICSRAGSLPEIAGDAAEYFDPYDTSDMAAAILRILDDALQRAVMAERGRLRAAAFTWDNAARQLLAALERAACATPA